MRLQLSSSFPSSSHAAIRRQIWGGALALGFAALLSVAPVPVRAQALPDFTELVERVGPAVVNIRTTERARSARGGANPEIDEDLLEFSAASACRFPASRRTRAAPRRNPTASRSRSNAASARVSSSMPTAM